MGKYTGKKSTGAAVLRTLLLLALIAGLAYVLVICGQLLWGKITGTDDGTTAPTDGTTADASTTGGDTTAVQSTTVPTTAPTTAPTTQPPSNLPAPLSGKYLDMVVEPVKIKEHESGDKVVYVTIDDGPSANTPKLLDVLDECGITATFFVTAQQGDDDKIVDYLKQIYDRGHVVAVHTYSHEYKKIYASIDTFLEDYKRMDDLIMQATGERAGVFRLPGGSDTGYNKSIRDELLAEMTSRGLVYHDWNAFDGATEGLSASEQMARAVKECQYTEKSVLLMHNTPDKPELLETLPDIVSKLMAKGYRFDVLDGSVKPFQFAKVSNGED